MQIRRQLLFVIIAVGLIGVSWLSSSPEPVSSALVTETPSPVPTDTPQAPPTDTPTAPAATDTPVPATDTPGPTSTQPPNATNTPSNPGPTNTPPSSQSTPNPADTPVPDVTPEAIPALGVGPGQSDLLLFGIGLLGAILLLAMGWWRVWKHSCRLK